MYFSQYWCLYIVNTYICKQVYFFKHCGVLAIFKQLHVKFELDTFWISFFPSRFSLHWESTIIVREHYSPWNVLLSHLNGERTLSERWTNAERTQSERCVNAERNLVNDMWTVNGERTQNASGAQTRALSERWTQGERKMNDLFGKPRVFSSALSI